MPRPLPTVATRLATLVERLHELRQRLDTAAHTGFQHVVKRFQNGKPDQRILEVE